MGVLNEKISQILLKKKNVIVALVVLIGSILTLGSAFLIQTNKVFNKSNAANVVKIQTDLNKKFNAQGKLRIIVKLKTTYAVESTLTTSAVQSQRALIASNSKSLTKILGSNDKIVQTYKTIPYIALEITPEAFERLKNSTDLIEEIKEDPQLKVDAIDNWNIKAVNIDVVRAAGYDGSGQVVAVIDSSFDPNTPAIKTRILEEVCLTNCPNGTNFQIGAGMSKLCDSITQFGEGSEAYCYHGTYAASTISSTRSDGVSSTDFAVAPGAKMIVFRTLGKTCDASGKCNLVGSFLSSALRGLDWIYENKDSYSIDVVSMSLHVDNVTAFGEYCDSAFPELSAVIANLTASQIPMVVAAGNSTLVNKMYAPGCMRGVFPVGSINRSLSVSSFTDGAPWHENYFMMPGEEIPVAVPYDPVWLKTTTQGTSFAAPQLAGLFAILKQVSPDKDQFIKRDVLKLTGNTITDTRAGANNAKYILPQIDKAIDFLKDKGWVTPTEYCVGTSGSQGTCNF